MTVLLGWKAAEHGSGDDAALQLAAGLALVEDSPAVVATVVPPGPISAIASRIDREYLQWRAALTVTRQAEAVTGLRRAGVDDVRTAVVPGASVPAGLIESVHRYRARVLVLGVSAASTPGRFTTGSVAEQLLRSSPVPLALAPRDWAGPGRPNRLTCAWAGTARSREALATTRAAAARWGVPVRMVTFVPERAATLPSETGPRVEQLVGEEWAGQARGSLEEVVGSWPGPGPAPETVLARGAGWAGAVAAVPWEPGDALVIGSSRLGPPAQVFLGSTATEIVRVTPVPVLVVPRGADGTPSPS
ncbi:MULTISPECIES: universal stress protein [unclassified Modestobacter]